MLPCPGLCDGGGVGEHADGPLHLGQVSPWHHCWRLVVDTNLRVDSSDTANVIQVHPYLEASGAPVNELDAPLGLDGGDGSVDVLGHNVPPVQHAARHVLPVPGVALHHLRKSCNHEDDTKNCNKTWFAGSKQALVTSATLSCSWKAWEELK